MSGQKLETIRVRHQPSPEHLRELGVSNWPIWTKEVSEFPRTCDEPETCYLLAGEVTVTPDGGDLGCARTPGGRIGGRPGDRRVAGSS